MNYQVGDTIEYTTFDGSVRRVLVQSKEDDIKNGRAEMTIALCLTACFALLVYDIRTINS